MRAALIVNDRAGSMAGLVEPRAALLSALRSGGFTLRDTLREGMTLDDQWAHAEGCNAEVVFVAGGDGTLRDAAARLVDDHRAFAPLPGGTMNRVCTRLGLAADPVAAARMYRPGPVSALRIGTANGEVFLYQSIVGAPSRLMRFREMQRGAGVRGWAPVLYAALRGLARPATRRLAIRMGGHKPARGHAAVITLPGLGEPAVLTLDLARPNGFVARLRQAIRWFGGGLGRDAEVESLSGGRIMVHGRTPWLRLSLDGEMRLIPGPIRFRLHPGVLRLLPAPGVQ